MTLRERFLELLRLGYSLWSTKIRRFMTPCAGCDSCARLSGARRRVLRSRCLVLTVGDVRMCSGHSERRYPQSLCVIRTLGHCFQAIVGREASVCGLQEGVEGMATSTRGHDVRCGRNGKAGTTRARAESHPRMRAHDACTGNNHLCPEVKKSEWSEEEDRAILQVIGRWWKDCIDLTRCRLCYKHCIPN